MNMLVLGLKAAEPFLETRPVVPNLFWCQGRISYFRVNMEPRENTEVIITKIIKHESTY